MKTAALAFIASASLVVTFLGACGSDDGGGASSGTDAGTSTDSPTSSEASGGDANGNADADADAGDTSTADAPGDTGSEAGGPVIGPGPYTVLFSGTFVGIDLRTVEAGNASFNGAKLSGFQAMEVADERPTVGTNVVNDVAAGPLFALGRWAGGTTGGKFNTADNAGLMTLPANGGFHYVIGIPADPIPSSGLAMYSVEAKTVATVSDGTSAPGTITGSLAANLSGVTTKIGLTLTLDVPGDAMYTVATTGGVADPSQSEITVDQGGNNPKGAWFFSQVITTGGAACASGALCSFIINGFVGGAAGEKIALVAHVFSGSGGSPKSVSGAVVFKK